jgi:hypothetical protein
MGARGHPFNRSTPKNITVTWEEIGCQNVVAPVRDLWQHKDLGKQTGK